MKCAILCGGLGTRLHPLTLNRPKSLVDVNGRPFIFHQLDLLQRRGIREVVLCIGHLGWDIVGELRRYYKFPLDVKHSHDGDGQLGTAGALRKALPLLGDSFFVLYGDSYLDAVDYHEVAKAFKDRCRLALMTVCRSERANCIYHDGKISLYDKRVRHPYMAHIDYGLSVLHRSALDGDESDLADVFHKLSECQQLAGYEVAKRYHNIGSLEGLEELRGYLK